MIKILKWAVIILIALAIIGIGIGWYISEPEPKGQQSAKADEIAEKMMASVNKEAWDTTGVVEWTFMDMNNYIWDKHRNFVKVTWDDTYVLLNTSTQEGLAFRGGQQLGQEEATEAVKDAWSKFCNDSFWLNAVVKAKDPGTTRSMVTLEDGREGLKISYESGGVTPGDSYVWLLDNDFRPTSYKMWVQIIPVGGLEVSWENWTQLSTGAWIAQNHKTSKMDVTITDLKGAANLTDLTGDDIFSQLVE